MPTAGAYFQPGNKAVAALHRENPPLCDLANEAGLLDECVEELFADGGFWAQNR